MLTTNKSRVFQVHPTRRCNLECLHCYSSSGPRVEEELSPLVINQAVADAATHGYDLLGISGGEPLLYPALSAILANGRSCGMRTTVTTNGMLSTKRRLEPVYREIDFLGISLDGVPESHNRMRKNDRAFETMARNLDAVRETNVPFGFIFTLTQHNLNELEWVAEFAISSGASLLQIHPLEEQGRASRLLAGHAPDGLENGYACLEFLRLQELVGSALNIHIDIVDALQLAQCANPTNSISSGRLSDHLSPVVLETDGTIVPLQYGFPRQYALGSLLNTSFADMATAWLTDGIQAFNRLCASSIESASTADHPFVNIMEAIMQSAQTSVQRSPELATLTDNGRILDRLEIYQPGPSVSALLIPHPLMPVLGPLAHLFSTRSGACTPL